MRPTVEYVAAASAAYEKYRELQDRISKIEANARAKHNGNLGAAAYDLKTGADYWLYRDLVNDRDVQLKIVEVNGLMAQIVHLAA